MSELSRSQHILELAKEILDDIELSRVPVENSVMKATRLARYVGSEEIRAWLKMEMGGYYINGTYSEKYMSKTGRWTNKEENKGYWGPIAQIEANIRAQELKLEKMSLPSVNGDRATIVMREVMDSLQGTTLSISKLRGVVSRVIALIHQFVSDVYYEKTFDKLSESLFESYKNDTDLLIIQSGSEVLLQIPAVMDRLSEEESEAVSQALTTCRRIIDSFADALMPASDETYEINGNQLSLKQDKVQNRINVYIHKHCTSSSRRKRFKQNLSNLYDRVSTGVHRDVDVEEAKALFLNTYLLMGEILNLKRIEDGRQMAE